MHLHFFLSLPFPLRYLGCNINACLQNTGGVRGAVLAQSSSSHRALPFQMDGKRETCGREELLQVTILLLTALWGWGWGWDFLPSVHLSIIPFQTDSGFELCQGGKDWWPWGCSQRASHRDGQGAESECLWLLLTLPWKNLLVWTDSADATHVCRAVTLTLKFIHGQVLLIHLQVKMAFGHPQDSQQSHGCPGWELL